MSIRVIVNGARGKMGKPACEAIRKDAKLELVAETGREDNLAAVIADTRADVVLDLTRADSVFRNACTIIESGAHPVIGTSGLLEHELDRLASLCQEHHTGGIVVPNFSIAAVLMMRFCAEAARWIPDVEIVEGHHPQKLDAPSGTAIRTAQIIANARQAAPTELPLKEILPGARGATCHNVPVHAIRLPGILARQQVIFGSPGETLSITHDSIDRASFMPGVVLACQKATGLDTLCLGLETLLH